jgi:cold shock CspA family protein
MYRDVRGMGVASIGAMQIHWAKFEGLPELQRMAIERRLRALAHGHNDLLSVRLVAHATRHHRHGGQEVRIVASVRGKEVVACRERPDLGLALNETLDDFEREILELRQRRKDLRTYASPLPPHLGIVERVFVDQDYGFVLTDEGERVYFHRNATTGGLVFEALDEGQRVGLQIEAGDKGPQATAVVPAPPDAPAP